MEIFVCEYCLKSMPLKIKAAQRGTISSHMAHCKIYQKYIAAILSEDFLQKEYVENGKSASEIGISLGIGAKAVIKACKQHGISSRSISQSKMTDRCKTKFANTNMERYGSPHNMCRDHPARKKMIANLSEQYGVTNVFQRPDVIAKIDEWYQLEGSKQKRLSGRLSKMHYRVFDHLKNKYTDAVVEFKITIDEKHRRFYDIAIPSKNLLIEIHGDKIHGNPSFYKKNEVLSPYGQPFIVVDKWKSDEEKLTLAENNGWYVLYLWCSEIYNGEGIDYVDYVLSLNEEKMAWACRRSVRYLLGDFEDG